MNFQYNKLSLNILRPAAFGLQVYISDRPLVPVLQLLYVTLSHLKSKGISVG